MNSEEETVKQEIQETAAVVITTYENPFDVIKEEPVEFNLELPTFEEDKPNVDKQSEKFSSSSYLS